jgi:hypothetical protein
VSDSKKPTSVELGRKEAVGKLYTCRLGERLRTRAMAMKLRDRNVLIINNVPRLRNSLGLSAHIPGMPHARRWKPFTHDAFQKSSPPPLQSRSNIRCRASHFLHPAATPSL